MRLGGIAPLYATAVLLLIVALAPTATAKRETKTYTVNTGDGPVTVTETHVSETSSSSSSPSEYSSSSEVVETSGWSSSAKELLKDSKVSDMSAGDLSGSLVLAIDKNAISKGLKKYIMDALKKLPVKTKKIKIGFVEYTDRPYTIVSLKQGWSLDRILARLQIELSKSRHAKRSGKVYDYVGIQAAYNELQKFGKSSGPRIVMLLSSGRDANTAKTEKWRHKLMKEWISLSEIVVDSSSGIFNVKEGGKETSTDKTLEHTTFLTTLLKSYSHSTIQYYKKIYGEAWEFYIVLKHYKTLYPGSWQTHLKTWFTNKYGDSTKFETYLHRTESKTGSPVSPEDRMRATFKKKYGSAWEKHFLIWKYKKLYGLKWKIHYEQHLMKKKYGKDWFSEWEKLRFKKKYGKKWEPHYVKWYFRKYRGATWIYSWKKWQFRQKHKEGSKAYVDEFMRWYFKYTKKGDKALEAWKSATKDLSEDEGEKKFRWFYYNLVFQKKQALIKYTKWFYRKRFGKKFLPKYKLWLNRFNTNKHWMKYYKLMETQLAYTTTSSVTVHVHSIRWFKKKFGSKWRTHYEKYKMKKKYGKNWFSEWEKLPFKKKYGKKWEPHYVKWYFKKYRPTTWIYSWMKWKIKQKHKEGSQAYVNEFMRWYFRYKKAGSSALSEWKAVNKDLSADKKEMMFRWFYYNLVFKKKKALIKYTKWHYRKIYGKKFLTKFKEWEKKINSGKAWIRLYQKTNHQLQYQVECGRGKPHVKTATWYKRHYGRKWRWYYTRVVYRRRYGRKWRVHFRKWLKRVWKKPSPKRRVLHKVTWYKRHYGRKWRWYYTRVVYRRRYGRKWRVHFRKWLKRVWKKPSPKRRVLHKVGWFKRRYGTNWRWYYTRVVYQHRFGRKWRVHFKLWEKHTWKRPAPKRPHVIVHTLRWFKKHYPKNWRWYYTRLVYHRKFGIKWRSHFRRWVKTVWKKPSPKRRVLHKVTWYKRHYGRKWRWYYTRVVYRRRYGRKWRVHFRKWLKRVWKKPSPKNVRKVTWFNRRSGRHAWRLHVKRTKHRLRKYSIAWFKHRYGSNWKWFYVKRKYRRRYGSSWRVHFKKWRKTVWKRPAPKSVRKVTWFNRRAGRHAWRLRVKRTKHRVKKH